jgi:hypothetical protein
VSNRTRATGTQLVEALSELCERLGYYCHHETDSRRTNPVFPDLLILVPGVGVVVVECKSLGEKFRAPSSTKAGRRLPGQVEWLEAFIGAGVLTTYVCRDYPTVAPGYDLNDHLVEEVSYDELVELLEEWSGQSVT